MVGAHGQVPLVPPVHRRLRDPGQRVPEAPRRRAGVPARVGRARAPGALLDDRRPPAGGDPGHRRRAGGDRPARGGAHPRRGRSVRRGGGGRRAAWAWRRRPSRWPSGAARWATSATTWCAPWSTCPAPRPTTGASRTWSPWSPGRCWSSTTSAAPSRSWPRARSSRTPTPRRAYWRAVATLSDLKARLSGPVPRAPGREGEPVLGPVTSNFSREDFEAAVERAREYIFAGDAFQIVPSQRFSAPMSLDPFAVYRGLRTVNPSPYMYFLETGEMTLVGSSPEMLVKVEDGVVEVHPIAGSRPAGRDEQEDERLDRGAAGRPQGARRARDARRPGAQRPGPGLGDRHRARDRADGRAPLQPRDAHRELGGGAASRRGAGARTRCARPSRPAPCRARPRSARWRSSTSWSPPGAGRTAAPWAGSAGTGASTPASPSARSCATTAWPTCRPAPASWPTPCRRWSTRRPRTRRRALFRAIEVAAAESDW